MWQVLSQLMRLFSWEPKMTSSNGHCADETPDPREESNIMRQDALMAQEELERIKKEFKRKVEDIQARAQTCIRKIDQKRVK